MTNAVGNPIRGWDSRDHVVRSAYDVLHRRTELRVQTGVSAEVLAEKTTYGETLALPAAMNHRGKVYQVNDGAGVVTNVEYDFKGNLLTAHRQLAAAFGGQLDWSLPVALETETFVQQTQYDALNRPTSMTMPDQSVLVPEYNEAGLLEKVVANVRGAQSATIFVDDIDYDAKGQRERIVYGNGVVTEYEYDELTYRVKRIKTTRMADSVLLQDLRYYYDAVGNIVEMADLAQSSVFYGGDEMKPVWKYEYDAIYRLINATGREHAGQNANIQQDAYGFPLVNAPNANDPQAMRNYAETYAYDQVGNFSEMIHATLNAAANWTRRYNISTTNNRLLGTSLPTDGPNQFSENYLHDTHGNMQSMPHLNGMGWDFKDQMVHVDKGGGGDVYFTYDASGQRVRKVWVHNGITEERIYLGGFELYRRHELGGIVLERETLHIMDDTRRIAMVETKTIDTSVPNLNVVSRTRYQCSNHLGSATLELDETGQVISYEEYHPYGTSAYRATNGSVEVSAKRYRYTGKERDEETGLYYHGARYYACWLGRWTSADPAGMVDGPNLFQYVGGRPVGMHDPAGMAGVEPTPWYDYSTPEASVTTGIVNGDTFVEAMVFADDHITGKAATSTAPSSAVAHTPAPMDTPSTSGPPAASTGEAVGAFAKGAATGLATGIAFEAGLGAAAAVAGVSVGVAAAAVGIFLLPIAIYGIASNWDDITAGVDRLLSGNGTVADYEAAGDVAGGLLSLGASKPASAVGKEIGEGVRAGVKSIGRTVEEALSSTGPKVAPAGPGGALLDEAAGNLESRGGAGASKVTTQISHSNNPYAMWNEMKKLVLAAPPNDRLALFQALVKQVIEAHPIMAANSRAVKNAAAMFVGNADEVLVFTAEGKALRGNLVKDSSAFTFDPKNKSYTVNLDALRPW